MRYKSAMKKQLDFSQHALPVGPSMKSIRRIAAFGFIFNPFSPMPLLTSVLATLTSHRKSIISAESSSVDNASQSRILFAYCHVN